MTSDATPGATPRDRRVRIAFVVLIAAVAALWLPSLRCDFVSWDDPDFCVANPDVAHPSLRIFDPANWVVGDWTPMATVTYAAERALLGPSPWVPHATNVALHLVSMALVVLLLRDVGFGPWQSLGVALVFGVHPLQAESVAWVSARKNVLVAVFSLAYLRSYLGGRHAAATLWLLLALCSKATAVGLPLVGAAAQFLGLGAPRGRSTWFWIAAWTGLSVARASISLAAQSAPVAKLAALGLGGRMAYMGSVLTTQAGQVVAPSGLSVLYEPPRRSWSDPVLLAQWAGIAAFVALCAWAARRDRRLAFVLVFALAAMAPTLNVFPGPCLQADRYLHLPLIAAGALVVAAVAPLARWRPWAPAAVLAVWAGALLVPETLARQAVWRNSESLFDDACRKTPASAAAWGNLGAEFSDQGRYGDARLALEKALALHHPEPHTALRTLAFALYHTGDVAGAEARALEALAVERADGRAEALIGRILCETDRVADAEPHLDAAARLEPSWVPVWLYRAEWRVRTGDLAAARAELDRARALPNGPRIVASVAAAVAFLDGRADDALATLRAAATPDVPDEKLRALLAAKLRHLGRPAEAEAAARSR